jgi:ABC-2 type transport system permease protein
MRAYWAHFRTSVREDLRYFLSDSLLGGVGYVGFMILALLFYHATGAVLFFNAFTWEMLVWYIVIAELLIANQANVINIISDQVQNGEIVNAMAKPYHYPLALLARHMGSVVVESSAILLFAVPLALTVGGGGALSCWGVLFGLIAVALAFLLDFALTTGIGLIAFWTEDAKPYAWIYGKIMFVLGGLIFPLDIFPAWLQAIAKVLPPAFMIYYPARLIVDFSWPLLLRVLIGQLAYLLLFTGIAYLIYRRAIKRVSVNGG